MQRLKQKDYEKELVLAQQKMKENSQEKLLFKAKKVPGSLKVIEPPNKTKLSQGLKGVSQGIDQSLNRPEKILDAKGCLMYLPGKKGQKEKKRALRKKSLEDIDPDIAFQLANNPDIALQLANDPSKFGMDFRKYFSELQIKFAESFAEKKGVS